MPPRGGVANTLAPPPGHETIHARVDCADESCHGALALHCIAVSLPSGSIHVIASSLRAASLAAARVSYNYLPRTIRISNWYSNTFICMPPASHMTGGDGNRFSTCPSVCASVSHTQFVRAYGLVGRGISTGLLLCSDFYYNTKQFQFVSAVKSTSLKRKMSKF